MAEQLHSETGDADTTGSLCAAAAVNIVGGTYKGRTGHVVKVMNKKVEVQLDDGKKVQLMQTSVKPRESEPQASAEASTEELGPETPVAGGRGLFTGSSHSSEGTARLQPQTHVMIESGCHSGQTGTISSVTEKMYHVELDSGGKTCVKQAFVIALDRARAGHGRAFQRVSGFSEEVLPSDSTGEAPLAQWLWSGIKTLTIQAPHEKEEECFITCYFGQRRLPPLEEALSRSIKNPPSATPTRTLGGQEYHLLSTKVLDDGTQFWGGKKKKLRMMYVAQGEHSLQHELERLADFASIPLSCKIAARLELMQSSGTVYKSTAEHFEDIPEPQPSTESGGCGFIPQELLYELVAGRPHASSITSIQVRIFGPRLGVLKGLLTLRRNIQKIQLPPSMRKVGPSKVCSDEFVYIVVTQAFPSSTSFELAKCLLGTGKRQATQSLLKKQGPKLSDMVRRLLQGLGVGQNDISAFEKERPRQEAFLVGVTDPSFAIPEGQVFLPNLIDHVPVIDGVPSVFVSRCPCIEPKDGKRLRVLVERPSGMSLEDWDALRSRAFGEIIFPGKGRALPESIAEGDLDGDRYYVCWNNCIVSSVSPCQEEPAQAVETGPKSQHSRADPAWLARAQEHMLKPETIHEKDLIGRLYKAAEIIADESELGIRDPDARTLFIAYRQAIDQGKHGGEIDIPEHLRQRFRL
ncbi:RDR2 [Symbiodinium sp. CCMP2592]|nr:RDR2 [Symbiodinium sp. CCMP2592]